MNEANKVIEELRGHMEKHAADADHFASLLSRTRLYLNKCDADVALPELVIEVDRALEGRTKGG